MVISIDVCEGKPVTNCFVQVPMVFKRQWDHRLGEPPHLGHTELILVSLIAFTPRQNTHTLNDITAETNLEHLQHIACERCRSRSHVEHLTAEKGANLAEHESVVDFVSDFSRVAPVFELCVDGASQ